MEESRLTRALVLKKQPYREKDSLVSIYSEDYGKLTLLARGTASQSSKLAGHLDPLNLIKVMIIPGKGFDYIGSALVEEPFFNIRSDLNRLFYAGSLLSRLDRYSREGDSDQEIFNLSVSCLSLLSASNEILAKENGELVLAFFILRLLGRLGYKPEFNNCLLGGEKIDSGKNYFRFPAGGLICAACRERDGAVADDLLISDNAIKLARFLLGADKEALVRLVCQRRTLKELSRFLELYERYLFD